MAETDNARSIFSGRLITRAQLKDRPPFEGKSDAQIRRYERAGMPVHKKMGLRLYDPEEIEAWLRGQLPPPRPKGRPRHKPTVAGSPT
jgi:hypothetical protein